VFRPVELKLVGQRCSTRSLEKQQRQEKTDRCYLFSSTFNVDFHSNTAAGKSSKTTAVPVLKDPKKISKLLKKLQKVISAVL
jgi:hypothetical protein